jgi:hypothetical protein
MTTTLEEFMALFPQRSNDHWDVPMSVLKVLYLTDGLNHAEVRVMASQDLRAVSFFLLWQRQLESSYQDILDDVTKMKVMNDEAVGQLKSLSRVPNMGHYQLSECQRGYEYFEKLTTEEKQNVAAGLGNPKQRDSPERFLIMFRRLSELLEAGNNEGAQALLRSLVATGTERQSTIRNAFREEMTKMPFRKYGLSDKDLRTVGEWLDHAKGFKGVYQNVTLALNFKLTVCRP